MKNAAVAEGNYLEQEALVMISKDISPQVVTTYRDQAARHIRVALEP